MKKYFLLAGFCLLMFSVGFAQQKDPWTKKQLMSTETLVQKIENKEMKTTHLIHIGFEDMIPGSINAGPGMDQESLTNLKKILKDIPKDEEVVIYCGCCPMDVCPNIRPAFEVIASLGYQNLKLLDIPTSIKADWIDKDYPVK